MDISPSWEKEEQRLTSNKLFKSLDLLFVERKRPVQIIQPTVDTSGTSEAQKDFPTCDLNSAVPSFEDIDDMRWSQLNNSLLQAVRALMIVGIVLGAIGCLIAIFSLKCLKMGNMEDNMKATMSLTSGIMFLLAGVCGIAGVSAFANLIVQSFRFTTYAEGGFSMFGGGGVGGLSGNLAPRYTFGPALFVGWIGAAILVIGGILMCLACRGMTPDNRQRYDGMAYKAPSHHTIYKSDRPRPAYNDSYKAQSMDGPQSNQRFDYV